ncbi:hypothetical protein JHS3_02290 [Jeongeupia sp. HS-3]|uniref:hypothetical protein n=1 Tax=Jeongeupia sp. HS-3 TaxID=1009682 RepID=UPI0018A61160|nr:hypothetical protein [Jeongeupia sp. HS-3]BCL74493.1 hypothetical protein JHS3_02290 [Jeongeupia sp. HS-3]
MLLDSGAWYLQPGQHLAEIDRLLTRAAPPQRAAYLVERGRCLEALWQPQAALRAYDDAAALALPDATVRCRAHLGAAAIHYAHADYGQALGAWQQALPLARGDGDEAAIGEALLGLGRICQAFGGADAALSYNAQALQSAQASADVRVQAMIALNVVSSLNALRRYDEMSDSLAQAAMLIAQTPGQPFLAEWQVYAGIAAAATHRLGKARQHYDAALALADGANNHWVRAFALLHLGLLQLRLHDGRGALASLYAAREIGEAMGTAHTLMDIHQAISQAHETLGNIAEAFEQHKLYYQYYRWTSEGLRRDALQAILPLRH